MRHRSWVFAGWLAVILAIATFASVSLAGQAATAGNSPAAKATYTPPRTPDGQPDLQGIYNFSTLTPLQRPGSVKKDILADEDLEVLQEAFEKNVKETNDPLARPTDACGPDRPGDPGCHDPFWVERGTTRIRRPQLLVDPPDGRIPALTPEAQRIRSARVERAELMEKTRMYESWFDLPTFTRCVSRPIPRITQAYNHGVQIVQSPGYVMIFYESMHDARIIPTTPRPPLDERIRLWNGNSRGRWDGNTLVIESANFTDKQDLQGSPQGKVRLTERLTPVDANSISYEVTIEDPTTWTKLWTFELPWRRDNDYVIFEYACHEGNIQMANIMRGARAREKAAEEAAKKNSR